MEFIESTCFYCIDQLQEIFGCLNSCLVESNIQPAYPASILLGSIALSIVFFMLSFYFRSDLKKFIGSRLLSIGFFSVAMFTIGLIFNGHFILKNLPILIPAVGIAFYSVSYFMSFHIIKRNYRYMPLENKELKRYIKNFSKRLKVSRPKIYVFFSREPGAFLVDGFKKAIFLSDSLIEKLNEKEIKAVILHELYHLKRRSGFLKNLFISIRSLSFRLIPLPVNELENREEMEIDKILLDRHNTDMNKIRRKLW